MSGFHRCSRILLTVPVAVAIFCLGMLTACSGHFPDNQTKSDKPTPPANAPHTDHFACMPDRDTVIDSRNRVEAVRVDTSFTIKLTLDGLDTLLNYRFSCPMHEGLVPGFYAYSKGAFVLLRGYGFHYREFVVVYREGKTLVCKYYETALAAIPEDTLLVYCNYDSQKVMIENFRTDEREEIAIPSRFRPDEIPEASIRNGKLLLTFSNGSFKYPIHRK